MSFEQLTILVIDFIQRYESWAIPIVFILAFGESLIFVSLLLPATVILFAVGALIGQSEIAFLPIWLSAIGGAFFGDWLSYWLGVKYQKQAETIWPLSKNPQLLNKGYQFFQQWGRFGVFIGRFFGPLRAVVPLVAGICQMRQLPFQVANISSAIVWATGILAPGAFGLPWLAEWFN